MKIGNAATTYGVSTRTLRYWEETGILHSVRARNGYRYYDEANLQRIRQLLMLRKLRLPIQDIQNIFTSNDLTYAITILQKHLEETRHEIESLQAIRLLLDRLIHYNQKQQSFSDIFSAMDIPDSPAQAELKKAFQITFSERSVSMSTSSQYSSTGDVRIVNLPKMRFICYRAESTTPENDCAQVINTFIMENSLHLKNGFRHFGFNNPNPQKGTPVYGYEMWAVIPDDFKVPQPFTVKDFPGGLFAALPTCMSVIGEQWGNLSNWVKENPKYEIDWNPKADRICLEECIDFIGFFTSKTDDTQKQLDLLTPIKIKGVSE